MQASKNFQRFNGQVAVVAGGAGGIGLEIATRLGKEGAKLLLIDRSGKALEESKELLKTQGIVVESANIDIRDSLGVQTQFDNWISDFHKIDVLVNSVGIIGPTNCKILEYPVGDFQKVLEVNLTGAFVLTKTVLTHMLNRNYGRILHITSIGGKEGNPGMAGYAASKAGMIGLVKGVGKEYAGTGVTVNGIAPAVIATQMNEGTDAETLNYMTSKIPMGRLGSVEEVASLAAWIVSSEASFNTGYVFDISGGRATY